MPGKLKKDPIATVTILCVTLYSNSPLVSSEIYSPWSWSIFVDLEHYGLSAPINNKTSKSLALERHCDELDSICGP